MGFSLGAIKSDVFLSRRVNRARAKPTIFEHLVGFARALPTLQSDSDKKRPLSPNEIRAFFLKNFLKSKP
jgi:hypothetical protein